jgi:cell division protease FtsH
MLQLKKRCKYLFAGGGYRMKKVRLILLLCVLLLSAGFIAGHQSTLRYNTIVRYFAKSADRELSYPSFLSAVKNHTVKEVILTQGSNYLKVRKKNDSRYYIVPNPHSDHFIEFLLTNAIKVSYGQDGVVISLTKALLLAAAIGGIFLFVRSRGTSGSLIRKAANGKNKKEPLITLSQVAGNAEAKSMVSDVIAFIQNPEKYAAVGARMPKGLLFYGSPGTGKTLLAKAIAGEAGVPFYAMSGSDFVQMYVGVGASRIRSLFQKAKKSEKAVIFIDEIDAIGKKRARSNSASNDERDQTLNALLTEMSGFHENKGIIVIGATNRLDTLDEALLRPGRFDRQIEISLPDVNARKQILSLYAGTKPLSDDVDLNALAKSTVCFSGAMLENLLNEAAINAANGKRQIIDKSHIDKAFHTVIAGAPKQDLSYISDHDREITACHEAGHALVTTLLLPEQYISKVTIIPSVRGAGGFHLSIPEDSLFQNRRQISASIQVLLAGRAAEELIHGIHEVTTGASNDLQRASSLLTDYMNKYGMDPEMGLFCTNAPDSTFTETCRERMKVLYEETRELLKNNRDFLEKITAALLEKESINGEDIEEIRTYSSL